MEEFLKKELELCKRNNIVTILENNSLDIDSISYPIRKNIEVFKCIVREDLLNFVKKSINSSILILNLKNLQPEELINLVEDLDYLNHEGIILLMSRDPLVITQCTRTIIFKPKLIEYNYYGQSLEIIYKDLLLLNPIPWNVRKLIDQFYSNHSKLIINENEEILNKLTSLNPNLVELARMTLLHNRLKNRIKTESDETLFNTLQFNLSEYAGINWGNLPKYVNVDVEFYDGTISKEAIIKLTDEIEDEEDTTMNVIFYCKSVSFLLMNLNNTRTDFKIIKFNNFI